MIYYNVKDTPLPDNDEAISGRVYFPQAYFQFFEYVAKDDAGVEYPSCGLKMVNHKHDRELIPAEMYWVLRAWAELVRALSLFDRTKMTELQSLERWRKKWGPEDLQRMRAKIRDGGR